MIEILYLFRGFHSADTTGSMTEPYEQTGLTIELTQFANFCHIFK
jgi:hypothetical protein